MNIGYKKGTSSESGSQEQNGPMSPKNVGWKSINMYFFPGNPLYRDVQKNLSTPFNWRWRRKTYEIKIKIYNKKIAPDSGPTLQLDVGAPQSTTYAKCAGIKEVIDPLHLRNLRNVKLRQGLTKCRDRHGQARPIICVPFWAITRSLCVSMSIFVSPSLFCL